MENMEVQGHQLLSIIFINHQLSPIVINHHDLSWSSSISLFINNQLLSIIINHQLSSIIMNYPWITLWLFNIAMENDPFIDDVAM